MFSTGKHCIHKRLCMCIRKLWTDIRKLRISVRRLRTEKRHKRIIFFSLPLLPAPQGDCQANGAWDSGGEVLCGLQSRLTAKSWQDLGWVARVWNLEREVPSKQDVCPRQHREWRRDRNIPEDAHSIPEPQLLDDSQHVFCCLWVLVYGWGPGYLWCSVARMSTFPI